MRNLLLAFIFLVGTPVAQARFWDVVPDHMYGPAIDYLAQEKIVQGYDDRSFRPELPVARAEFVKIVVGALFAPTVIDTCLESLPGNASALEAVRFEDVSYQEWYGPYLCIAVLSNLIEGYPDGTFRPQEGISFAETAKILANAYGVLNPEYHNINVQTAIWYKPYVDDLADLQVIPPTIRGFAYPITRGEMAEMIYRLNTVYRGNLSSSNRSLKYSDLTKQSPRLPYKNRNYGFYLTYPDNWPAPYLQKRGLAHDGVPVIKSDWRLYLGFEDLPCLGLAKCNERRFYIDGYQDYHLDQLMADLHADSGVEILSDELSSTQWRLVYLDDRPADCRSKRALIIRKGYLYRLTAVCSEGSALDTKYFDDLVDEFKVIKIR